MALYKKIEFAKKCGVTTAYLSVNIKRGKVVVMADGMVDDRNPINAQFFEKRERQASREKKITPVSTTASTTAGEEKAPEKNGKRRHAVEPNNDRYAERFDLDTNKRKVEILKLEREAEVAALQHEKLIGKLVPVDPVRNLFMQTIKSFTMSFKQAADKVVMEFGKVKKMNRNEMAEMRGVLIKAVNIAAEDGITESKKQVHHIVRQYADAKKV